jgi:hypothetical protein
MADLGSPPISHAAAAVLEALSSDQGKALLREAMTQGAKDLINDFPRNAPALFQMIEAVRSSLFILDNIPLPLGKTHGLLRHDAIRSAPAGLHCEFGTWKGAWITEFAKNFPDRRFYGFDSFEGLPEEWSTLQSGYFDLKGELPAVPPNVTLVKGWFNESIPPFLTQNSEPVAFIHMDCDLYSSTMTVL